MFFVASSIIEKKNLIFASFFILWKCFYVGAVCMCVLAHRLLCAWNSMSLFSCVFMFIMSMCVNKWKCHLVFIQIYRISEMVQYPSPYIWMDGELIFLPLIILLFVLMLTHCTMIIKCAFFSLPYIYIYVLCVFTHKHTNNLFIHPLTFANDDYVEKWYFSKSKIVHFFGKIF